MNMRRGPNAASSDALVAVVFAAFAAEAFVNELDTCLERESIAGYPSPDPRWADAAEAIRASEAGKRKPYDKVIAAHKALSASPVDGGREPYQSFRRLMTLRDWIGHTKPERNAADGRTIPDELRPLRDAGLTYPRPPNVGGSWLDLLLTDLIADWACHVTLNMIRYTLDLVPGPGPAADGAAGAQDPAGR